MIIVGELINMTRKPVEQAWKDRDEEAIASLATKQAEAKKRVYGMMEQLLQALQAYLNSITPITGDAPQALSLFVFFVQWAAIILSALAGLYAARKQGMDVYGSLVIGFRPDCDQTVVIRIEDLE